MSTVLDNHYDPNYDPSAGEIEEYGKWLGMILPADADLLWLAKEGLCAPLPDQWKACKSEKGELYYFNFNTGKSIWDHPMDEHFKTRLAEEKAKRNANKENEIASKKDGQKKLKKKDGKKASAPSSPLVAGESLVPTVVGATLTLEAPLPGVATSSGAKALGASKKVNGVDSISAARQLKGDQNSVLVSDSSAENSPNPSTKSLLPTKKIKPLTELDLAAGTAATNEPTSVPTPRSSSGNSKLGALKKLKHQSSSSTADEASSRESSPMVSITAMDSTSGATKHKSKAAATGAAATPAHQKVPSQALTPAPFLSPIPMAGDTTTVSIALLVDTPQPKSSSKSLAPLGSGATPSSSSIPNLEGAKREASALFEKEIALHRKSEELRVQSATEQIKSTADEAIKKLKRELDEKHEQQASSYKASLDLALQSQAKTLQLQFEDMTKKAQQRHDEDIQRHLEKIQEAKDATMKDSQRKFEADLIAATAKAVDKQEWKRSLEALEAQMGAILAERQIIFTKESLQATSVSLTAARAVLTADHEQQMAKMAAEHSAKLLIAENKHAQSVASLAETLRTISTANEAALAASSAQILIVVEKLKAAEQELHDKEAAIAKADAALTVDRKGSNLLSAVSPVPSTKAQPATRATTIPASAASAYDSDGAASSSIGAARTLLTQLNTHFANATTSSKKANCHVRQPISDSDDSPLYDPRRVAALNAVLVSSEERLDEDDLVSPTMTTNTAATSPTAPAVTATEVRAIVADVLRDLFVTQQQMKQIEGLPIQGHPPPPTSVAQGRTPLFTHPPASGQASILDVTLPTSFRDQHGMLAAERQRVTCARDFLQIQQDEIAERKVSLKDARRQWKRDVFQAKAEGYRSDSQKGQLLKNVHKVLEKQAAGLAHDEMVLMESQSWLGTKEQRLAQLEEQLASSERAVMGKGSVGNRDRFAHAVGDASVASIETAALISDFFQNESLLSGGKGNANTFAKGATAARPAFADPATLSKRSSPSEPAVSDALDRIERRLEKFAKLLLTKSVASDAASTNPMSSNIRYSSSPARDTIVDAESNKKVKKEYRRHRSSDHRPTAEATPAIPVRRSASGKRVDFAFPTSII